VIHYLDCFPKKLDEEIDGKHLLKFVVFDDWVVVKGTLLIWACCFQRKKTVKYLLSKGANKSTKFVSIWVVAGFFPTFNGKTPLEIAQHHKNQKLIKLLSEETKVNPLEEKDFDHIGLRIMDVSNEPNEILNPILGLLDHPLPTFDQAIVSLQPIIKSIDHFKFTCDMFADTVSDKDNLSSSEISAIHLYTREWEIKEESLYFILNAGLRAQNREATKPFYPYLHLLLHSMCKLPRCEPGTVVWRGITKNISDNYPVDKKKIWWGMSSCTKNMKALDTFLGKDGHERTLFNIQVNSAVDISKFSAFKNEAEVLLFPCITFMVLNVYSPSNGLWIIQLKEIFAPSGLIKGFDELGKN